MNQFISFLLILLSINLSSNEHQDTRTEAITYYDSINYWVNSTRPPQQKFIDSATAILNTIKTNENTLPDTSYLTLLLNNAKKSNMTRVRMLENISEVDEEINYKNKVLDYAKLLDSLYNDEFKEYINLLGQNTDHKFQKCSTLLLPRLVLLDEAAQTFKKVQPEFKAKYNFKVPSN